MVSEDFFHLIDLACVNSWLLWRRNNSYYMPLVDFKVAVADALCKAGKVVSKKVADQVLKFRNSWMLNGVKALQQIYLNLMYEQMG